MGIFVLSGCTVPISHECYLDSRDSSLRVKERIFSLIGYDGGIFVTKDLYDVITLPSEWEFGKKVYLDENSRYTGFVYIPVESDYVIIKIMQDGKSSSYNGKHKLFLSPNLSDKNDLNYEVDFNKNNTAVPDMLKN